MPKTLADFLLLLHFLWVVFMLIGFPLALVLRSRALRLVHAAGLASYLLLAAAGWACPLTWGEEALRGLGRPGFSYHGSCLATWAEKIIYVQNWGAPLWIFRVLAVAYLLLILSSFWWWPGRPGARVRP